MSTRKGKTNVMRRFLTVLLPALGVTLAASQASAQEIQVTGPLAGAPAVRNLRLHRKGRFELAPTFSFTLLDEYQRTWLAGARINYNITDWLGLGIWGAFGVAHPLTGLSDKIQQTNNQRFSLKGTDVTTVAGLTDQKLTYLNLGEDFQAQLGKINWVLAPQITAVPFRGKLAIFQSIFVDTDAYFFAGPAFVNLTERANCTAATCSATVHVGNVTESNGTVVSIDRGKTKDTASRVAIAPTFGIGLSFYSGKFMSLGLEWRGLPFSWNTGGFDTRGGGPNNKFPDNKVDEQDRQFKFNQMVTISVGFYLPTEPKISE